MATVESKKQLICSDCSDEVYTCDRCTNYLKEGEDINCEEDKELILTHHYCIDCKEGK